LTSIAKAVDAFRKRREGFCVLVATERLACAPGAGASRKAGGVPVFSSDNHNMYELVSILRSCHMIVSSRYHGIRHVHAWAGTFCWHHDG